MNNAIINIKTDTKTKQEAQKIAAEFGVSLSSLITMTLRNDIRTKRIDISLIPEARASQEEIVAIEKGLSEYRSGKVVALDSV
jgi:addiction module RelB/DinJ family antitoxin